MSSDIFAAVQAGDLEAFERHLAVAPELADARDAQSVSLLLHTLYQRRPDMTKAVRARRSMLDFFEAAALGEHDRVEDLLQSNGANVDDRSPDGFSALHLACFFDQKKVAESLLQRGANFEAASSNAMQVMPLHSAVAAGSDACVKLLLASGANPDVRQPGGHTPAMGAAASGNDKILRRLVDHGADLGLTNDDGKTARDLAEERGHARVVKMIEEKLAS